MAQLSLCEMVQYAETARRDGVLALESVAREAADYLTAHEVGPEFLRVQGCSVYEPLIQHAYAPDARVLNRRVEVEVTSLLLGERQGRTP